jgi:hypothetical protein
MVLAMSFAVLWGVCSLVLAVLCLVADRLQWDECERQIYAGAKNCNTSCALDRSTWVRRTSSDGRAYYSCRECGRFIGWIRDEVTR